MLEQKENVSRNGQDNRHHAARHQPPLRLIPEGHQIRSDCERAIAYPRPEVAHAAYEFSSALWPREGHSPGQAGPDPYSDRTADTVVCITSAQSLSYTPADVRAAAGSP